MDIQTQLKPIQEKYEDVRKRLQKFMIIWIAVRAVAVLLEVVAAATEQIEANGIFLNAILIGVCFLFAKSIVMGTKGVAYLALAGGLLTIFNFLTSAVTVEWSWLTGLQVVYLLSILVVGVVQTVIMLIVVFSKQHQPYFQEIKAKSDQIAAMQKQMKKMNKRK